MKKRLFISLIMLILVCPRTWGQAAAIVTNPTQEWQDFMNHLENIYNEGLHHAETIAEWTHNLENFRNTYQKISSVVTQGRELVEFVDDVAYLENKIERVIRRINRMADNGTFRFEDLEYMHDAIERIFYDTEELFEYISDDILGLHNNMTTDERVRGIKDGIQKVSAQGGLIDGMMDEAERRQQEILDASISSQFIASAFGLAKYGGTDEEADDKNGLLPSAYRVGNDAYDNAKKGSDNDPLPDDGNVNRTPADKIFTFVQTAILILMALMVAWGFFSTNFGRQHEDALFKAFAGGMIALLILQLLKVALYKYMIVL